MNNKRMIKSWLIAIVVVLFYSLPTWAEVSNKVTIKKVAVVEEGTGTWCMYCPRGIVGLEMLNKEFGDNVITIAIHGGKEDEPMLLPEYRWPGVNGYPGCRINRGSIIDPYYGEGNEPFGIKSDVEAVLAEYAPAGIDVKAEWADSKQTAINITTTTLFAEDISNQPYQIGYVLLENGLTSSGKEWIQYNSLEDDISDQNLLPMTKAPFYLSINYDHVPVAAWETYYGVSGTIPENVVKGKDYTYTFKADITGNTHIQDKGHLTVVALLLDKKTGKIVNGAKIRLLPSSPIRKAYSVITGNTLTLYYDENMEQRHGDPFYGCFTFEKEMRSEITHVIIDSSCEKYFPSSLYGLFENFENLKSIEGMRYLNTSNVIDMTCMFDGCSGLTSLDVSKFNTSNVTYMDLMFCGCSGLTSLDVSKFDTSNVKYMDCMFYGCSGLTSLDVSKFDTSNVTSMGSMFDNCSGLTSLDVSKFNTSNVTYMVRMFYGCSSLTSLDVSNFDTSNVTNMCSMFIGCSGLMSLDLSNFDTSNVKDMTCMFVGCSGLTSLDLSNFDTSNVTNMEFMFSGCSGLTSLDVSKFNTSNVKYMESMFAGCSGLTSLDVSKFNTSNVIEMESMFAECSGLTSLDLSNFDTSNVKYMHIMFYGCSGLTSLDLSNFDTSNVTNMDFMFFGCSGLTSLDVSKFNTSNVKYMNNMFDGCSGLPSLDVSKFNTSNVKYMNNMFDGCSGLMSLDLSNFDTSNVKDMTCMFDGCSELKTIYAKNDWNTNKVENGDYMFWGCSELVGGKGTKYNYSYSYSDHTYARIDGGESAPGYFTIPGLKGDCNGDGTVDKADIAEIENYIMGRPSTVFIESVADVNYDGVINVADIVEIVNSIKVK